MKKLLLIIMAIIIVGGGAFYAGMKYAESKAPRGFTTADSQNLRNLSSEERQERLQELGANIGNFGAGPGERRGAGFVNGEIIAKDDKSITIKLRDGGSKIIFFSDTTEITKSAEGSPSDLEINKTISANGDANQDGSIIAKTIQISPQQR